MFKEVSRSGVNIIKISLMYYRSGVNIIKVVFNALLLIRPKQEQ